MNNTWFIVYTFTDSNSCCLLLASATQALYVVSASAAYEIQKLKH